MYFWITFLKKSSTVLIFTQCGQYFGLRWFWYVINFDFYKFASVSNMLLGNLQSLLITHIRFLIVQATLHVHNLVLYFWIKWAVGFHMFINSHSRLFLRKDHYRIVFFFHLFSIDTAWESICKRVLVTAENQVIFEHNYRLFLRLLMILDYAIISVSHTAHEMFSLRLNWLISWMILWHYLRVLQGLLALILGRIKAEALDFR